MTQPYLARPKCQVRKGTGKTHSPSFADDMVNDWPRYRLMLSPLYVFTIPHTTCTPCSIKSRRLLLDVLGSRVYLGVSQSDDPARPRAGPYDGASSCTYPEIVENVLGIPDVCRVPCK